MSKEQVDEWYDEEYFDHYPKHDRADSTYKGPLCQERNLFALHTGCRAGEIAKLRWEWEVQVPELGVSVFVLPEGEAKNNEERVVILNTVARRVTDERRGEHSMFSAGAPVEDRKALLGHTNGEITTHYSAAELGTLLKWAEAIVDARPSTALRTGFAANVVELRQKRGNLPR